MPLFKRKKKKQSAPERPDPCALVQGAREADRHFSDRPPHDVVPCEQGEQEEREREQRDNWFGVYSGDVFTKVSVAEEANLTPLVTTKYAPVVSGPVLECFGREGDIQPPPAHFVYLCFNRELRRAGKVLRVEIPFEDMVSHNLEPSGACRMYDFGLDDAIELPPGVALPPDPMRPDELSCKRMLFVTGREPKGAMVREGYDFIDVSDDSERGFAGVVAFRIPETSLAPVELMLAETLLQRDLADDFEVEDEDAETGRRRRVRVNPNDRSGLLECLLGGEYDEGVAGEAGAVVSLDTASFAPVMSSVLAQMFADSGGSPPARNLLFLSVPRRGRRRLRLELRYRDELKNGELAPVNVRYPATDLNFPRRPIGDVYILRILFVVGLPPSSRVRFPGVNIIDISDDSPRGFPDEVHVKFGDQHIILPLAETLPVAEIADDIEIIDEAAEQDGDGQQPGQDQQAHQGHNQAPVKPAPLPALEDGSAGYLMISAPEGANGVAGDYPAVFEHKHRIVLPQARDQTASRFEALDPRQDGDPDRTLKLLVFNQAHGGVGLLAEARYTRAELAEMIVEPLVAAGITAHVIVLDACLTASVAHAFLPLCAPGGRIVSTMYSTSALVVERSLWPQLAAAEDGAAVWQLIEGRMTELVALGNGGARLARFGEGDEGVPARFVDPGDVDRLSIVTVLPTIHGAVAEYDQDQVTPVEAKLVRAFNAMYGIYGYGHGAREAEIIAHLGHDADAFTEENYASLRAALRTRLETILTAEAYDIGLAPVPLAELPLSPPGGEAANLWNLVTDNRAAILAGCSAAVPACPSTFTVFAAGEQPRLTMDQVLINVDGASVDVRAMINTVSNEEVASVREVHGELDADEVDRVGQANFLQA